MRSGGATAAAEAGSKIDCWEIMEGGKAKKLMTVM